MQKWIHRLAGLTLLLAGLTWTPAAQAQAVPLKATLVLASNDSLPLDYRLDKIAVQLRRVFKFENYTQYGEAESVANVPSQTTLDLGHGYLLRVSLTAGRKGRLRAEVEWVKGDTVLVGTRVGLSRGVPAILGGPSHEGGTLIVVLVAG